MDDTPTAWLTDLDRRFHATVSGIPDAEFATPTALPGWTRAHVVAHVHFNALALCRLLSWAATGVPAPMYASREQRGVEIEAGAAYPPADLRELAADSATRLSSMFADLSPAALERTVTTALGRQIPAREVAWLRCRELGVHAVDLDAGTSFEDLPTGFTRALVHEIVAKRVGAGEGPGLAAWLTGRRDTGRLAPWL
jgi:maleylpyruvate isomerase